LGEKPPGRVTFAETTGNFYAVHDLVLATDPAGRPDDIVGAAISCTRFGQAFRSATGKADSETVVALTYRAQFTPRLSVQADAQFTGRPTTGGRPGQGGAAVLGLRTAIAW
jgi:carbohydrate-selective porin OprB